MRSLFSAMGMYCGGSRIPSVGWSPPDEGLHAHDLGGPQVDVGLVDEKELVAVEGRDQIVVELAVVHRPASGVGRVGELWNISKALRPWSLALNMASSARLRRSS